MNDNLSGPWCFWSRTYLFYLQFSTELFLFKDRILPALARLGSSPDMASLKTGDAEASREANEDGLDNFESPDKATDYAIAAIEEDFDIDSDNSPIPEVRANVPNFDDPSMPINTLRMWLIGIVFTILSTEHAVITIMSNLSFGPSWATDIIQAQKASAFYNLRTPVSYQFLLSLTMQLFGLGMAGLSYRFIVEPFQMVWPSTLANAALFQTLHGGANLTADGWKISRYRFFVYVFVGGWLWYWLSGFLFTGLSTLAFVCWAAPNNVIVNNLFSYLPTTFDWSQIAYNGSPLVVPFWAQANVFADWLILFTFITPILYYNNTWNTAYMPFSGSDTYDNTGNVDNATRVVERHGNFLVDEYRKYSPIFMPVTFALSCGISFAVMTCVPTYIFLNHWRKIIGAFNSSRKKDIHVRMIENIKTHRGGGTLLWVLLYSALQS
ncbi:Fc.00g033640.m01.CDS01 [Cosmosporella sp. VM-42]